MKRLALYIISMLLPLSLLAQSRAEGLMSSLVERMQQLGGYEATYMVVADDLKLIGAFSVDGDRYRIEMADMEVWGDGVQRYEVDKRRQEVVITTTESTSANILSNPAHALEMAGSVYDAALLQETATLAELSLQNEQDLSTTIRLKINLKTGLPSSIVYLMDGTRITIDILSISPLKTPIAAFEMDAYEGFELIDFR